jgi:hypothetical protein
MFIENASISINQGGGIGIAMTITGVKTYFFNVGDVVDVTNFWWVSNDWEAQINMVKEQNMGVPMSVLKKVPDSTIETQNIRIETKKYDKNDYHPLF